MKHEFSKPADVMAEAEHWFARLRSEECSAVERMAFRQWHAQPQHASAYAATEALWEEAQHAQSHPEIERLMREVLEQTQPATVARRRWQMPAALAASVAVIAVALSALLLWPAPGDVYQTALGERRTVTLDDGSVVTLNTETKLRVRFRADSRALELIRGEALFDVAHDAQRPFLVSAGDSRVRALGTRFQVRRDNDEQIKVVLLEGRVEVAREEVGDRLEMAPGEQVSFTKPDRPMTRRAIDPEAALSWTSGRLVFRATPLVEAVAEVNRYAKTKIRLADDSLSQLRISGTFVTGDSELLARALETDMPVHADFGDGKEIVLRRR
jgi:transmembrane sensor